jgi:hypothetical protein
MHVNDFPLIKGAREPVAVGLVSDSLANPHIVEARTGYPRACGLHSLDHVERTTLDKPRKNLRGVSQSNRSFHQQYRDPLLQAPSEPERIAA